MTFPRDSLTGGPPPRLTMTPATEIVGLIEWFAQQIEPVKVRARKSRKRLEHNLNAIEKAEMRPNKTLKDMKKMLATCKERHSSYMDDFSDLKKIFRSAERSLREDWQLSLPVRERRQEIRLLEYAYAALTAEVHPQAYHEHIKAIAAHLKASDVSTDGSGTCKDEDRRTDIEEQHAVAPTATPNFTRPLILVPRLFMSPRGNVITLHNKPEWTIDEVYEIIVDTVSLFGRVVVDFDDVMDLYMAQVPQECWEKPFPILTEVWQTKSTKSKESPNNKKRKLESTVASALPDERVMKAAKLSYTGPHSKFVKATEDDIGLTILDPLKTELKTTAIKLSKEALQKKIKHERALLEAKQVKTRDNPEPKHPKQAQSIARDKISEPTQVMIDGRPAAFLFNDGLFKSSTGGTTTPSSTAYSLVGILHRLQTKLAPPSGPRPISTVVRAPKPFRWPAGDTTFPFSKTKMGALEQYNEFYKAIAVFKNGCIEWIHHLHDLDNAVEAKLYAFFDAVKRNNFDHDSMIMLAKDVIEAEEEYKSAVAECLEQQNEHFVWIESVQQNSAISHSMIHEYYEFHLDGVDDEVVYHIPPRRGYKGRTRNPILCTRNGYEFATKMIKFSMAFVHTANYLIKAADAEIEETKEGVKEQQRKKNGWNEACDFLREPKSRKLDSGGYDDDWKFKPWRSLLSAYHDEEVLELKDGVNEI